MTFVYWGGNASAKKHLLRNLSLNNKKYVQADDYKIKLHDHTCHWNGYVRKHDELYRTNECWDITERSSTFYHDKKGKLVSTYKEHRKLEYVFPVFDVYYNIEYDENYVPTISYRYPPGGVTGGAATKIYRPLRPTNNADGEISEVLIDSKYAKRFKKNPPSSMLHYEAVSQYPPKKGEKKMTIDDIPDCHLIIPNSKQAKAYSGYKLSEDWFFQQDWNRYRNIVPIRTDLLDFARINCGSFGISSPHEENTVLQIYKEEKERIFGHFDHLIAQSQTMMRKLKKEGISYEFFDIDKGSYKKTFELNKEFGRTSFVPIYHELRNCDNKRAARANFQKITEIAKEWLHLRNYPKNNIPENL